MRAQFVRHSKNPLDSLEIGHARERRMEKVKEDMTNVMNRLFVLYGDHLAHPYKSTGKSEYEMGFSQERKEGISNSYSLKYDDEEKTFEVYVIPGNNKSPKAKQHSTLGECIGDIKKWIEEYK